MRFAVLASDTHPCSLTGVKHTLTHPHDLPFHARHAFVQSYYNAGNDVVLDQPRPAWLTNAVLHEYYNRTLTEKVLRADILDQDAVYTDLIQRADALYDYN